MEPISIFKITSTAIIILLAFAIDVEASKKMYFIVY